ncbi:MAG: PfkB family carbohydrate kinase [Candidatus Palauibacterales bacterium]|nr:PfkB family carbohydrate kinase [Candidatus Palauibacterales bacterium]
MSHTLVVGSVALDTIETPFGRVEEVPGGSAVHFSAAASVFGPVRVVGVVGPDYPDDALGFLRERDVDLEGLRQRDGRSFRWSGVYDYDLNARETLSTELGVFSDFRAEIPDSYRDSEWIFLGNIDPRLQLEVLEQIDDPRLVAADTMNYWIENEREALLRVVERVDLLTVNDAEVRELSGDHNLARAARWILDRGPEQVVVKKGEHGAILFGSESVFFAPGFPLEEVFDPTGAGDAFAGGLLGRLARGGEMDAGAFRRAVVHGCAMGSFACEEFGVDGLARVQWEDVARRVLDFQSMTSFDHEIQPPDETTDPLRSERGREAEASP